MENKPSKTLCLDTADGSHCGGAVEGVITVSLLLCLKVATGNERARFPNRA